MNRPLRIGTRGSALALAQAQLIKTAIEELHSGLAVEVLTFRTSGDRVQDRPLATLGGKGLFVKEIEDALLDATVDVAVHSMKDLPAELAPGLLIAAVPPREDPGDVLIARSRTELSALPTGARVGTSSLRRMALLRSMRRDVEVVGLRGNVDTRLRKLRDGEIDATVLAAAGLKRLGLHVAEAVRLDPSFFLPAIGQGALAIETRADEARDLVAVLEDRDTRLAVEAERAFMKRAAGSCVTPMAAHAVVENGALTLRAVIVSPDGQRAVRGAHSAAPGEAFELGERLAEELLDAGGADILRALGVPV